MVTKKPTISTNFERMIEEKAKQGTYRMNLEGIIIDVFPYIFPPQSPFSESTHTVYDYFGNLESKKVLDIGTGTGIQAIQAAYAGAVEIDAIDILDDAVECAKHNVLLNGLEGKIRVWQSDLFCNVPKKRYDLIIANLPIVEAQEQDLRLHSLYDPGFSYHSRFFREAYEYLSDEGKITLCHANIEHDGFEKLERTAIENGFTPIIKQKTTALGYEWRNYEFKKMSKEERK